MILICVASCTFLQKGETCLRALSFFFFFSSLVCTLGAGKPFLTIRTGGRRRREIFSTFSAFFSVTWRAAWCSIILKRSDRPSPQQLIRQLISSFARNVIEHICVQMILLTKCANFARHSPNMPLNTFGWRCFGARILQILRDIRQKSH